MNDYFHISILDYLRNFGEDRVRLILSEFKCPKNPSIEYFLQNNAVEFAKRRMSITYLVFTNDKKFVGFFTLTHKSSLVPADKMSKTACKKLSMYARLDESNNCYDVSAFLIAQLGKNFAVCNGNAISGNCLMDLAAGILQDVRDLIGGGVVFLECEESPKLLDFYQNDYNRFRPYGRRFSPKENKEYIQLLKFI